MRINVGCGEFPAAGWLNVDCTHEAADLRWDATAGLPPAAEPIDRIYAGHVLEHLPYEDLPAVLTRWREHPQVTAGTVLAVVGPDCDQAERLHRAGSMSTAELDGILHGGGRWTGDVHLWRSTGGDTADALRAAGWTPRVAALPVLAARGWPVTSLIGWQFALLARAA